MAGLVPAIHALILVQRRGCAGHRRAKRRRSSNDYARAWRRHMESFMDTHATDHHQATIRVEDDALVRGHGRFVDDDGAQGHAYGFFLRSPHAFARIRSIDTSEARNTKGVLAVLTAAEMKAAGVGNVSAHPPLPGRGGAKLFIPFRPALADGRVMHVGQ